MLVVDAAPYPRRYYYEGLLAYTVQSPNAHPWWVIGGDLSSHTTEQQLLSQYKNRLQLAGPAEVNHAAS